MYGNNVDAAIKFFILGSIILLKKRGMAMEQSKADQCLLNLHESDVLKHNVTIVNDCVIFGVPENIEWFFCL